MCACVYVFLDCLCVWVVPISTRYGVRRLMWQQNTFDFNLFGPCTCERKALMLAPLGMLKQDNRAVWQMVTSQGKGHSCGEHSYSVRVMLGMRWVAAWTSVQPLDDTYLLDVSFQAPFPSNLNFISLHVVLSHFPCRLASSCHLQSPSLKLKSFRCL